MDGKITERLIKLGKEHNLSQEQLADGLGVSRKRGSRTLACGHGGGRRAGVTVFLSCIVFFVLGGVRGLRYPWWVVFLTIPVYYIVGDFFKKS